MTLAPPPAGLPQAHGGCTCSCHRMPGILHFAPCCSPSLNIDPEWLRQKIEADPDEGEVGVGFEIFGTAPSTGGGYTDADALRDLQESILQSNSLADFMAVKKTVEAIRASEVEDD